MQKNVEKDFDKLTFIIEIFASIIVLLAAAIEFFVLSWIVFPFTITVSWFFSCVGVLSICLAIGILSVNLKRKKLKNE